MICDLIRLINEIRLRMTGAVRYLILSLSSYDIADDGLFFCLACAKMFHLALRPKSLSPSYFCCVDAKFVDDHEPLPYGSDVPHGTTMHEYGHKGGIRFCLLLCIGVTPMSTTVSGMSHTTFSPKLHQSYFPWSLLYKTRLIRSHNFAASVRTREKATKTSWRQDFASFGLVTQGTRDHHVNVLA